MPQDTTVKQKLIIEIEILDRVLQECNQIIPDPKLDTTAQMYGLSRAIEVVSKLLQVKLDHLTELTEDDEELVI
jgi:hypothetical protein